MVRGKSVLLACPHRKINLAAKIIEEESPDTDWTGLWSYVAGVVILLAIGRWLENCGLEEEETQAGELLHQPVKQKHGNTTVTLFDIGHGVWIP